MLVNNKKKIYRYFERYYDIDGISLILTSERYNQLLDDAKKCVFDILNKGKYSTRIMNSCKIKYQNIGSMKNVLVFFLNEITTHVERFNIFVVLKADKHDISDLISSLKICQYQIIITYICTRMKI